MVSHKGRLLILCIFLTICPIAKGKVINSCELIKQAKQFGAINPQLVLAVSEIESSRNSKVIGKLDPRAYHYGLMQLKLGTARMLGFTGQPKDLLNWKLNLRYGIIYLNNKLLKYRSLHAATAAYNAGAAFICRKGIKCKKGKYVNQKYVDLVMERYKKNSKIEHCSVNVAINNQNSKSYSSL